MKVFKNICAIFIGILWIFVLADVIFENISFKILLPILREFPNKVSKENNPFLNKYFLNFLFWSSILPMGIPLFVLSIFLLIINKENLKTSFFLLLLIVIILTIFFPLIITPFTVFNLHGGISYFFEIVGLLFFGIMGLSIGYLLKYLFSKLKK